MSLKTGRQRRPLAIALSTATLAIALAAGGTLSASAVTSPTDEYKPILAVDAIGVFGNPASIIPAGAGDQALTSLDATAATAAAATRPTDLSASQSMRFVAVGFSPIADGLGNRYDKVPVFQITNDGPEGRLCLTADAAGALAEGTSVSYKKCVANRFTQLWLIASKSIYWEPSNLRPGLGFSGARSLPNMINEGTPAAYNALVNYASYAQSNDNLSHALVLSAPDSYGGAHSRLALEEQTTWPLVNKLFMLRDLKPLPQESSVAAAVRAAALAHLRNTQPTQPECSRFACLIGDGDAR